MMADRIIRARPGWGDISGSDSTFLPRGGQPTVSRCDCARCAEGVLIAGHCVDVDGDYWHECPAVDAANTEPNENSWHPPNDLYPEED